jgi:hypothetical protein
MSERKRRKYRREQLILLLKQAARRVILQVREERAKHGKGAWSGKLCRIRVPKIC